MKTVAIALLTLFPFGSLFAVTETEPDSETDLLSLEEVFEYFAGHATPIVADDESRLAAIQSQL